MSNDKIESISTKLRRWANNSEQECTYPMYEAGEELFGVPICTTKAERDFMRRIADEIDAEKREITERYARQSWMNPAEAITKLANGEIEWPERTCENMAEQCFREAYNAFLCSRCGTKTAFTNVDYCPSCGAKVVSE